MSAKDTRLSSHHPLNHDQKRAFSRPFDREHPDAPAIEERPTGQYAVTDQQEIIEWSEPRTLGHGITVLRGYSQEMSTSLRRGAPGTVSILLTVGKLVHSVDHQQLNTLIGRHSLCDIKLGNEFISRMHANFDIRQDGFHLIDTSKNGTYVKTDADELFLLRQNWRFPMSGSGAISFGVPFARAGEWVVQYVCRP